MISRVHNTPANGDCAYANDRPGPRRMLSASPSLDAQAELDQ
jgi:hypothetical protein